MPRLAFIWCVLALAFGAGARGPLSEDPPPTRPLMSTLDSIDLVTGKSTQLLRVEGQRLGAPVWIGGRGFVASTDKKIVALDARTGDKAWEQSTDAPAFSILSAGGRLVAGVGSSLIAFNPDDGKIVWRYEHDQPLVDPVAVEDIVFFNTFDGPAAVSQSTGKLRWKLPIQWGYLVTSGLGDHRICIWKPDEIYAIDTETGRTLWQAKVDLKERAPGSLPSPAVGAGDLICQLRGSRVGARDWSMHGLDTGGNDVWKTALGEQDGAFSHTLIWGDAVFAALDQKVFALDRKTGARRWMADAPAALDSDATPLVAGPGTLLLSQAGGRLTALDATTGHVRWNDAPVPSATGNALRTNGVAMGEQSAIVSRTEYAPRAAP